MGGEGQNRNTLPLQDADRLHEEYLRGQESGAQNTAREAQRAADLAGRISALLGQPRANIGVGLVLNARFEDEVNDANGRSWVERVLPKVVDLGTGWIGVPVHDWVAGRVDIKPYLRLDGSTGPRNTTLTSRPTGKTDLGGKPEMGLMERDTGEYLPTL